MSETIRLDFTTKTRINSSKVADTIPQVAPDQLTEVVLSMVLSENPDRDHARDRLSQLAITSLDILTRD